MKLNSTVYTVVLFLSIICSVLFIVSAVDPTLTILQPSPNVGLLHKGPIPLQDEPPINLDRGLNNLPIIGVLTQPRYLDPDEFNANKYYLAASYVKFIESAGGRVVPVPWTIKSYDEAYALLSKLNGLLLVGGDSDWGTGVQHLLDAALALNKKETFPIYGICQGFQQILQYFAGDLSVLKQHRVMNQALALDFTPEAQHSRFYTAMTPSLQELFADKRHNVTMNFHSWGINTKDFYNPKYKLSEHFHLIATNIDEMGFEHVSVVEHKTLPVFGYQYHPEKSSFEFGRLAQHRNMKPHAPTAFKSTTPHTMEAILAQQFTANFLVHQARFNHNSFPTVAAEEAALIYNYPKQRETAFGGSFVEIYYFYYYDDDNQ